MVAVGAQPGADAGEVLGQGLLGYLVDRAAGGAHATKDRVGPLDDLHLLDVEGIGAVVLRAIAQAIDLHVGVGAEAADVDAVARAAAALPGVEGDPGDVGQHIAQAQRLLVLDHLLGNHRDGLRRVQQRDGVFGRSRALDLVGFFALAVDIHIVEFQCLALCIGHGMGTEAGEGDADGGGQEVALRKLEWCGLVRHESAPRLNGMRLYLGIVIDNRHPMQVRKCPCLSRKTLTTNAPHGLV
ncbi:hypothetical protein D3C76_1236530 [compost metagenome]